MSINEGGNESDRTHHVAMPVEGFYSRKELLIIPKRD